MPFHRIFKGEMYLLFMSYLKNISRDKIQNIYSFSISKSKEGFGQRRIARLIKKNFNEIISEGAISNWIYLKKHPFGNEKTQFKLIARPKKEELFNLYILQKNSAQKIAEKYNISTVTAIKWIKFYNFQPRTHKESMNTPKIRENLRNLKLKKPTKKFEFLSKEKAYILGVLCGDGFICSKNIRFEIRKDEDFIQEFTKCFTQVYGINYNYHFYAKKSSFVLYVSNETICSDLLRYGKFGTFEWSIPKEIFQFKDEKFASFFLRGIFDSEGSSSRYCVSMSSANEKGIKEIGMLLNKFAISNKIFKTKKGYYVLYITKRERLKRFREEIGFSIKRKMEPLNNLK